MRSAKLEITKNGFAFDSKPLEFSLAASSTLNATVRLVDRQEKDEMYLVLFSSVCCCKSR